MATKNVNFRMDETLKSNAEQICNEMGMSLSTAVNIFCRKLVQERRIPFEVTADPFFSPHDLQYLNDQIAGVKSGSIPVHAHNLIQDDASGPID